MAGRRITNAVMGYPSLEGSPRAATTDVARDRETTVVKRRLSGLRGILEPDASNDQSDQVYTKGLDLYQSGDLEGAVDTWGMIPQHPEARAGLRRVLQEMRAR